jgi:hypothetical protein
MKLKSSLVTLLVMSATLLVVPTGASAYAIAMHGRDKNPAVSGAVHATLGSWPSLYVIQHCTAAYRPSGSRWSRWAVEFTADSSYHNSLCNSVQPTRGEYTFVQVQAGYWQAVATSSAAPNSVCSIGPSVRWGLIDNLFNFRCVSR